MAQTETPAYALPRSFVIKSLSSFVGRDDAERLLCPVRALTYYLVATGSVLPRPSVLFVTPRDRLRGITKNAISYFIRETIRGAGALHPSEGQGVRAHSVRGVSTSMAFHRNCSLGDVLLAASWSSNFVFASFYLNDISFIWDGNRSLGPFVAAGQVLTDSTQPHPP